MAFRLGRSDITIGAPASTENPPPEAVKTVQVSLNTHRNWCLIKPSIGITETSVNIVMEIPEPHASLAEVKAINNILSITVYKTAQDLLLKKFAASYRRAFPLAVPVSDVMLTKPIALKKLELSLQRRSALPAATNRPTSVSGEIYKRFLPGESSSLRVVN